MLSLQSSTAESVQREIALMRACACPFIVGYYDAFHIRRDGRLALHVVMELAEQMRARHGDFRIRGISRPL